MLSHKKIMLSAIAASFLVAQGLYATDITDDSKLVQDPKNKGNYTYEFNTGDTIKDFALGSQKLTNDENRIKHLTIKAGKDQTGGLNFENTQYPGSGMAKTSIGGALHNGYSFDITADDVTIKGGVNAIYVGSGHSTINAKNGVVVHNTFIDIANGNYFNQNYNGSLTINGDLIVSDSAIRNNGQANFNVNGKVTANDTDFIVGAGDLSRVTSNGFYIMSANQFINGKDSSKSFTDETESGNRGLIILHNKLVNISSNLLDNKYADNAGTILEKDFATIAPINDLSANGLYEIKLVQAGNSLYVSGDISSLKSPDGKWKVDKNGNIDFTGFNQAMKTEFNTQITNLKKLSNGTDKLFDTNKKAVQDHITTQQETIKTQKAQLQKQEEALKEAQKKGDKAEIETAQSAYDKIAEQLAKDNKTLDELNNRLAEYDRLIKEVNDKIKNLNDKITQIDNNNFNITAGQKGQIFASLATSNVGGKIAGTADYIFSDGRVINDIEKAAQSNAGNSALNAPIGAINMSNDMAISNRLAKFSNPYSTMGIGEKFAAGNGITSDSAFAYGARSYDNNVWANIIGGANIIDSKSGALYGVSVGYDRLVGEDTILGAYLTYADSKIKTNLVNQESDNLQLGLYARTLYGNSELDFKGYAQFGWTDQDRFIAGTTNSSDFTRKFLGASGSYGYVFDMGSDFYIKPLAGLNLYYSYTPNYNENGAYAQHVQSQSSFDASIEAGAEFRKYLSKESYIYAMPKIEQYIITSGDDYTARFLGSPTSFTINGSDKKKTYGSFIVGGDVNIKDQWAFTFSAGVKHLLSGKVNDESETYLSGNIGLKYQF